jgi:hypothetical protein
MSPVGLGTENHCAGEGQQQFSSQAVSQSLNLQEFNRSRLNNVLLWAVKSSDSRHQGIYKLYKQLN